jgi:1-deoxy-D-xylulose-5-phosphate synthase
VGGLSKYLSRLSMKEKYQTFRRHFDAMIKKIPFIGDVLFYTIVRLKRAVKAVFYTDNFFVDLGFEYAGPINGHSIPGLIAVLEDVRRLNRPVVIHVITRKGKGYSHAEDDPGNYHTVSAASGGALNGNANGAAENSGAANAAIGGGALTFTDAFSGAMAAVAERDQRIVAITAAMDKGAGLAQFKKAFRDRFFDVGIAEEHAVTFAAGLASKGFRPVAAIYSTFIQRSMDQVIHDVALQNLPVIFVLDRCGFVGGDGETHQGLFDIALFRAVPNMTILAPASENELRLMLDYAARTGSAAMIRYPQAELPPALPPRLLPLEKGRGVWLRRGICSQVLLAYTGSLHPQATGALALLREKGIEADLYNLRFLKPVDEDYFAEILNSYQLAVFIEEGIRSGGFGEYAAAFAQSRSCKAETLVLAAEEDFAEGGRALGTRGELLKNNRLDKDSLAEIIFNSASNVRTGTAVPQ